jgi:hypothetical protein
MSTFGTTPHRNVSLDPMYGANHDTSLTFDGQPKTDDHDMSDDEGKKEGLTGAGVPVLTAGQDSDSSIDLEEKATGAVVLPWRVKVPALVLVIFFTRKPFTYMPCILSRLCLAMRCSG